VLEIGVPNIRRRALSSALADEWPSYLGYGLSFVMIGIMWMNPHDVQGHRPRRSRAAGAQPAPAHGDIVPAFPTAVLAGHLQDPQGPPDGDAVLRRRPDRHRHLLQPAVALYAWLGRRLIDEHVSDARLRSRTRRYLAGPLSYGITIPLAFVSPWLSIGIWIALAVLYLLPLNE
jgi:uncharacterized membrane protein